MDVLWDFKILNRQQVTGGSVQVSFVRFFFRPTPSWLPPGRSTCLRACCNWGELIN